MLLTMNDLIKLLLEVQDKDARIFNLRKQIISVPQDKERITNELQVSGEQLDEAKNAALNIEKEINTIEMDVGTAQEKIGQLQAKSVDIKKNEEYRALLDEVKLHEEKITELEDKQLACWERLEAAKGKRAAAEKEHNAGRKRIAAALQDLDVREKNCDVQTAKVEKVRNELAANAPADVLTLYDRLIKRSNPTKSFLRGVVAMEADSCGGCHLNVTPQTRNRVKKDELLNCENCGRFLYYAP